MNILSFPAFMEGILSFKTVSECVSALHGGKCPVEIRGTEGSFRAILISGFLRGRRSAGGACAAVVPTEQDANELALDLRTLGLEVLTLPWWGTLPYGKMAPVSEVFGERTRVLCALADHDGASGAADVYIIPERAFLGPLPPPAYLKSLTIPIVLGETVDTAALAERLVFYGYTRVPRVQLHGEFALRGEVLDILMGADDDAYRVLLDFDRVERIRRFDPVDQSGSPAQEQISGFCIRPMRELVWTDGRIDVLADNLGKLNEFSGGGRAVLEALMERRGCAGEEMFYPLAFAEGAACLPDYLGDMPVFFFDRERLENAQEVINREYENLFRQSRRDKAGLEYPVPARLLYNFKDLVSRLPRRISFMSIKGGGEEGACTVNVSCGPSRSFFGNIMYLKEEFTALLKEGWHILVAAESDIQAERIESILSDISCDKLSVTAAPLSAGFCLEDNRFLLVQENEIFGRRRRPPKSVKTVRSAAIDSFVELNSGDYVVHLNYGIGLFKGIERIKALGHERDYIQLEYLGDETVFVPIEQVNLVQRYIGNEGSPPRLDKLGSKSWEARKNSVKKSVEDIAGRLIALYSKRKAAPGFAFPQDSEWQTMFEAAFPFDETEDQLRCVEEIKQDMESPHPMDRLVCGDVGFGKTEVAVRACFKAVMGGRQVAFLAPTTILAEQHYENFQERFGRFPVKLAMLSRFVDHRTTKKTLEDLGQGQIDILVGTHRIIQKDVRFKNLGLLVIDEEQRFGVKDKERLKEFKTSVDCLTLSATPIPRTLHMSLLKIRDMSLLTTPPLNRHPIETIIEEWSEDRIAAAIRQEVERGGQIFFLHNRVESLNETRLKIERLVPEMLIETAHGQMDAQELEDVMHRFIHGGFHVLVSTTIIENGIDIPNVNTIIIDRADMYGVSQLYQLRGRVGRSDRVAYAYLLYPRDRALNELAMKRLQVISDFTELGSGFKIAMKDMEIRGAGNLLGREQSGDIYSVGFDLYLHLLDEAIKRLEDESYEGETETLLELEYSGFIPDAYIDSAQEKMEVYKKIASVRGKDDLERIYAEMLDRFGPLPEEAESLLALAEIRIICREIAVSSLRERGGQVRVEFGRVSRINVERLVRMMKESSGKVRLDPSSPNVLLLHAGNIGLKEKSEFIREKLAMLSGQ
ncbi:MAG: transcription-repair coupling factor [Treponema sp.]|jgi:transcription-repair coupling factor (superfamily II helicase)|nr:transcription-repair coupling factor [Treponema sp.]